MASKLYLDMDEMIDARDEWEGEKKLYNECNVKKNLMLTFQNIFRKVIK